MTNSYRFGVLSFKIIGGMCTLLFGACTVGAFMAGEYAPISIFAFFVVMGVFMIASAGDFEMSDKFIIHRNLFGTYRIAWAEVKEIEFGTQGSIILHGENKRFSLAPPAYWSGKQKPVAYDFFHITVEKLGVPSYPSNTADYKIHKNVRVRASDLR